MHNIKLIIENDYLAIRKEDCCPQWFGCIGGVENFQYDGIILTYRDEKGDEDVLFPEQLEPADIAKACEDLRARGAIDRSITSVTLPSGVVVELAAVIEQ